MSKRGLLSLANRSIRADPLSLHPWKICRGAVAGRPRCTTLRGSRRFGEFRGKSCNDFLRETGGAYRDRTDDLMLAKQPLSQLS
jgi:hypothetical protein